MKTESPAVPSEVLLGGRLLEILAKTRTTSAVKQISAKRRVSGSKVELSV